jgi:hypothetical protein
MLEYQALLLRSLQHTQSSQSAHSLPQIAILDAASDKALGAAHRSAPGQFWSRWLATAAWDIFESEDLSLVFSLRRSWPWSPEWGVQDAEGRCVGTVLCPPPRVGGFRFFLSDVRRASFQPVGETRIEDASGYCLARLHERGEVRSFLSNAGMELASLRRMGNESTLTFAEGNAENPFTRMLLLAAALAIND